MAETDLLSAMHTWLDNHPNPAAKCLILGKTLYSPKDIIKEIDKGSKMGKQFQQDVINLAMELFMKKRKV